LSDFHSFEIVLGTTGVNGKVLLDGAELRGVQALSLSAVAGDLTEIVLRMIPEKVVISAERMAEFQAIGVTDLRATIEATTLADTVHVYRRVPVEAEVPATEPTTEATGCEHPEDARQTLQGMGGAAPQIFCTKCGDQLPREA
jgi:hypothetical protein